MISDRNVRRARIRITYGSANRRLSITMGVRLIFIPTRFCGSRVRFPINFPRKLARSNDRGAHMSRAIIEFPWEWLPSSNGRRGSWNAARFSTYVEVYGSWIMERSQNVIEFQSSGKMSPPMQPFSFATISRGFSRHDARVHAETHEKSSLWKLW